MFFLGLDLGQKRDPSALAMVERVEKMPAWLAVRHVERMPLGLPYPAVVARIREIVLSNEFHGQCTLAVDATGVGAPVVDMLRAARLGCPMTAVTITGGEKASGDQWSANASVPKRDLMAEMLVLLEHRKLRIGQMPEGAQLIRELKDIRAKLTSQGTVRIGAEGTGEHDDLAMALALACWRAKSRPPCGEMTRRLI